MLRVGGLIEVVYFCLDGRCVYDDDEYWDKTFYFTIKCKPKTYVSGQNSPHLPAGWKMASNAQRIYETTIM